MSEAEQDRTPSGDRRRRSSRGRGRGRRPDGPRADAPRTDGADRSPDAPDRRRGRRPTTDPTDRARDAVQAAAREQARRERRAATRRAVVVPPITYPEELPVSARRADIAAAIRDHQVVVVAGETGSGKTTQLPKIALELGRGRQGQIGHTQPRRIAARSVAERISEEITGGSGALGSIVGYQVRFTDQSSEETLVKVMTDGILLAQIQRDPMLLAYDTLIVDEAHERSLNIDFILGYLTRLLPRRPDLKLVITSATIDSERFARHFAGPPTEEHPDGVPAPVVEVSGRTYPVEIRYRPLSPDPEESGRSPDDDVLRDLDDAPRTAKKAKPPRAAEDRDLMTAICEAVDELAHEGPGDVLVFLSGEREIRDAEEALRGHLGPRVTDPRHPQAVELLPLYSRLSAAEQHRVFAAHSARRVVLATNVAETSLTVPGVRYVVDPGTARISRWSKATKVQRLPIEPISQASANQRSGRCGRVAEGVAIRLYSEADLASRPEFTEPEILRTSLASVILQMVAVGVAATPDDVAAFPFVDQPDTRAVRDGVQLLTELGALETTPSGTRLTEVGRALAMLPMDPRLARMIVEGGRRDVAREVMVIAAALSIQDPRERPAEIRAQADALHARFADPTSDFLTYLNLWHHVREQQRELSGSAFRRLCKAEHLNYLRLREWQDVVAQLKEMAKPLGIAVRPPAQVNTVADEDVDVTAPGALRRAWDADRIHQSLLAGLLSHVGMQEVTEVRVGGPAKGGGPRDRPGRRPQARNEYLGARGARFAIFPGSPLSRKPPAWVMAGELVETSRLWARDVARIEPEWAEELGQHLVRRTYSEPAWSTKQGAATAFERVLLHGVPVVARRRVLYAKVDPEHARELFVRHALVQGEWTTHHRFFHDNAATLAEAEQLEHRARRRGLVVDDDVLFAFYDERVPADVVSARHFDQWWKRAQRDQPDLLTFRLDEVITDEAAGLGEDLARFPAEWQQGDLRLPLTYQFTPGTEADGVTVHIPLAVLNRVRPEGFDRLVPGMLPELVTATIRGLPKPVRVQLVPAPDVAREVVAWIEANEPSWEDTVRAADMAPSFAETFTRAVRVLRDVEVPSDVWPVTLPAHLRMTFRVHDERGSGSVVVDEGTDLLALQRRLAAQSQSAVRSAVRDAVRAAVAEKAARTGAAPDPDPGTADPSGRPGTQVGVAPTGRPHADATPDPTQAAGAVVLERDALTTWPDGLPDGRLPEVVTTAAGGLTVHGYPALVVEGAPSAASRPVALRVLADASLQDRRHAEGVRELLLGELALATGRITSRWTTTESLTLAASPYRTTDALARDLQRTALDALLDETAGGAATVRDAATYARVRAVARDALEDRTHRVARDTAAVLAAARELDTAVRGTTSLALLNTLTDVRDQSARLVHDGFVSATGAGRLPHLVRYLRAAQHRLAKAAENPGRDEGLAWQVHELEDLYEDAVAAARTASGDAARDARHVEVRWMLEELRVSLFAQHLGTPQPVSAKRIRTALGR
ncbi:ATP-dependent RNA helicase HrpA [Actinotalea sp. AC32]|nr:ATP-dependent RNA helicase HrpA [Actinotalea sp. AC32]